MLTNKDLELFKICEIPKEAAEAWLAHIASWGISQENNFAATGYHLINQGMQMMDGDIVELAIYQHSNNRYYLVQAFVDRK